MKHIESARTYSHMYGSLGIDIDNLGCLMLDVQNNPYLKQSLSENVVVDGGETRGCMWFGSGHITLLYGFMHPAKEYSKAIDTLLNGIKFKDMKIKSVELFETTVQNSYCLVATIKQNDVLDEAHSRLSFLPHLNTFAEYRPHITLAYVNTHNINMVHLNNMLAGSDVVPIGLNYGV